MHKIFSSVGHFIALLREESGLSQVALAKRVKWSQAVLSRIESGERGVSPEEVNVLLDAIGSESARSFAERLGREWEILPVPPFDHPDQDALWAAEIIAKGIQTLSAKDTITATFQNRLSEYDQTIQRLAARVLKRQHTLAFIGSIGVGKSTAICRTAPLELREENGKFQPVLEAGAGGITICEVHIQNGPQFGFIIEPCSEDEIRQFTLDFSEHILKSVSGAKSDVTENDIEFQAISKEIERAIRNMSGLRTRRERVDGKFVFQDDAKTLAASYSTPKEFCLEVLSKMQLHKRAERHVWYDASMSESALNWAKGTFEAINNGRHPFFTIPKRIEVIVPNELFDVPGLEIKIVDTKGIDQTAARADLELHLNDAHTVAILCSTFNNAPSTDARILLERATDAGVRDLELKTIILALPRPEEALAVKDDSGEKVESAEEGYDLKGEQISTALESLDLQNIPIAFFNAREDSPEIFRDFLREHLGKVRARMIEDLSQACLSAETVIDNQEREQTKAILQAAANQLRNWLHNNCELPSDPVRAETSLLRLLKEAHASTIHASIRRYGVWPSLSFQHHLGYGARVVTANRLGRKVSDFKAICQNLRTSADFADAHPLIEQSESVLMACYNDTLQKMQLLGESLFEQSLKEDTNFWRECEEEWGTGGGYRGKITRTATNWFNQQPKVQSNETLQKQLQESWREAVRRVESLLIQ